MAYREDWYVKNRSQMTFTGYEKDILFNEGEELFEGKLTQYPNAYDITVYRYYEDSDEKAELETKVIIQSLAGYKNINNSRKILARKSFGLRTGDLISYKNDIWLTNDWINRQRSTDDYSSLIFCNHKLSFIFTKKTVSGTDDFGRPIYTTENTNYSLPCYYTVNVLTSEDGMAINLPDNRAKAYIQYTKLLKVGDEVSVAGHNYRIYGIDNSYMVTQDTSVGYEYGVMILTLDKPKTTT